MLEVYRRRNFGDAAKKRIRTCNTILDDYQAQGLRLTLRQLYYQLVTKNVIVNSEKEYKKLGSLVSDARLAAEMDWGAIEDRVRQPRILSDYPSLRAAVEHMASTYRLPRWRGQENYVELWVEKDALAGVLEPLANEFHVTMMVNRGYSSQSAMYEAAQRFKEYAQPDTGINPRCCFLLYLGDHDPSGEDMVRDIQARLEMFEVDVIVRKVALTMAQVQQYQPPPNPAKMSDSRARAYVKKHGRSSWEVDALPPAVLQQIIRSEIEQLVDRGKMDAVKREERQHKAALRAAAAKFKEAT